ncbi:DNA recombination protein RmuC [Ruegeria pomeroyi]|uniref:DNA recombination protein RmuC homolog n=2 Tax=Ruegeria TaxID=97050 RepID=A0A9Q3ZJK9_9RHOB|nr:MULTISPECIES: DNA recombination protein RmuC [Ruegeria]MCE8517371.1 DNA recombination protein RmuC [Ruegeria pomeroyi]MCE8525307.1 DNA recombination protein RmuC [Ruegeria pomeroyi]MCE8538491.1 DNA recombination protein RmuC [Ruegeria pomeroyi]MCG6557983.1 DNA recombination protein RmuC [Ruegeria alba]
MIQIGDQSYSMQDPIMMAVLGGGAVLLLILLMLFLSLRAANRSARTTEPMAQQLAFLGQNVQQLSMGQEQLRGGLAHVSDAQANAQVQMIQTVEARLSAVQQHMNDRLADNAMRAQRALAEMQEKMSTTLHGSSKQTATSLTQLQERLAAIDKAQDNITKLSGDVLSLQDILSNKQTRGAFGEIQLNDIVSKALPSDSYSLQHTLSNGRRADCLIHLPNPPGPIVIDSKFPLEAYEALRRAETPPQLAEAARQMKTAVRAHIKAISERYIIEGETADGALLFLPSEAVYAELHANFADIVREGFAARVWIVSPTTCMATLNTMRAILKDARMREQAGAIRKELSLLHKDVERLGDRVENLDRHFGQAAKDISEIKISADKAGRRAQRLDNFDFEELAPDPVPNVVPLGKQER